MIGGIVAFIRTPNDDPAILAGCGKLARCLALVSKISLYLSLNNKSHCALILNNPDL